MRSLRSRRALRLPTPSANDSTGVAPGGSRRAPRLRRTVSEGTVKARRARGAKPAEAATRRKAAAAKASAAKPRGVRQRLNKLVKNTVAALAQPARRKAAASKRKRAAESESDKAADTPAAKPTRGATRSRSPVRRSPRTRAKRTRK